MNSPPSCRYGAQAWIVSDALRKTIDTFPYAQDPMGTPRVKRFCNEKTTRISCECQTQKIGVLRTSAKRKIPPTPTHQGQTEDRRTSLTLTSAALFKTAVNKVIWSYEIYLIANIHIG